MDTRPKVEKLRAMAAASESPNEAAVAQAKLAAMGQPLQAPRPRQSAPSRAPQQGRVVVHYGFRSTRVTFTVPTGTNSTGGW